MKRLIDRHLSSWAQSRQRKPLLLRGARQVGKTYSVRKLGRQFDHFVEVNFELLPAACHVFQADLQPKRIIRDLAILLDQKIVPGQTLLFLDEVQECPQAITALRYFHELLPDLHIVAAGSLLEFKITQIGLPVGRVQTMYLYPLSFYEFLQARNQDHYFEVIADCIKTLTINPAHHQALIQLLGEFLAIGGMPEALNYWIQEQDYHQTLAIQRALVETYRQDFDRYAKKHQIKYVEKLFNEAPGLIGEKFKYSKISDQYRKRELEPALNLLDKAGLIHKIYHTPGNLPIALGSDFNKFKLIFIDVALTQVVLSITAGTWIADPLGMLDNRGAIAEAFIGQEIIAYANPGYKAQLYYWHRESKSSNAEIDYLLQLDDHLIPIEIKSGKEGRMKSLHLFLSEHQRDYGVRYYSGMPNFEKKIKSLPLYCACMLSQSLI